MYERSWKRRLKAVTLIESVVVTVAIGVLLSLLLPTMAAAKERASRRACLNNLRQLGLGIESYTGDYAGYLPTWIGSGTGDWGLGANSYSQCKERNTGPCSESSWPKGKFHKYGSGLDNPFSHPAQHAYALYRGRPNTAPNVVGNRTSCVYDFLSDFRVIALGSRCTPDRRFYDFSDRVWPPPSWDFADTSGDEVVNYAPHGLGHLLVGGYIGDARAYYCPGSEDMLPDATAFAGGWSLDHWNAAGGFDTETMLYSDAWSSNGDITGNYFPTNGMIFSNYAYRGVPFWLMQPWCVSMEDKDPCTVLQFTKPAQYTHMGSPLFRTRKQLAGRALISDAFSKACLTKQSGDWRDGSGQPYTLPATQEALAKKHPGMAIEGHRDAYNVLYGDMHATTYADPKEKILWHASSDVYNGYTPYSGAVNLGFLGGQHWYPTYSPHLDHLTGEMDKNSPAWQYSSAKIWHDFDVAAGIDIF